MFIVFEGIDGSGLTTQSRLLTEYLQEKGHKAFLTKEPTTNIIGGVIRNILKGSPEIGQEALALLFAADRSEHMEIIENKLSESFVVCDRYYFSNFAYQMLQVDLAYLMEINAPFLRPDLTFFLDVPPAECKRRIDENRDHVEIFEHQETLERIRENYLRVIELFKEKGFTIVTVDGDKKIESVHEELITEIERFI